MVNIIEIIGKYFYILLGILGLCIILSVIIILYKVNSMYNKFKQISVFFQKKHKKTICNIRNIVNFTTTLLDDSICKSTVENFYGGTDTGADDTGADKMDSVNKNNMSAIKKREVKAVKVSPHIPNAANLDISISNINQILVKLSTLCDEFIKLLVDLVHHLHFRASISC